jgi:tetratricopeptide (TPR) repeat protein
MRLKILFLSFILLCSINFAQSEIEKGVVKGLDNCYNFRWGQAEEEFQKLIDKFPDDPRGYHYRSTVYLWYYLSSRNKNDYQNFIKYSDVALDKGKITLDKEPDNEIILYTIGTIYSCRAIVFAKAESYIDAAWASKKSEGYLTDALKANPKRADAYLGLGLYNFAVGQIPPAFKWALSLAGIKGNKALGIQYIKKAANEGYLSKVEALYYLSQIYSEVINNYESAAGYLKLLTKKYPNNILFSYSLGVLEIKRKNPEAAENLISKIIKSDVSNFKELIYFSNFLMGDIYFKENKFDDAKSYYLKFLNSYNQKDYKGIASYRLAVCYELTGDRNNAVKYFRQTNTGNMDLDDDIYAKREGAIYSKRTIAQTEADVIMGANIIEQGNYNHAIEKLNGLSIKIKSDRLKAEVNYYLSEASYISGNYNDALKYANICKGYNSPEENWIVPFADYNIARSYIKIGKKDEALQMIEDAEDLNNYDYQNKLTNLLAALKASLSKSGL